MNSNDSHHDLTYDSSTQFTIHSREWNMRHGDLDKDSTLIIDGRLEKRSHLQKRFDHVCYFTTILNISNWKIEEMSFKNCSCDMDSNSPSLVLPYARQTDKNIMYQGFMIGMTCCDIYLWKLSKFDNNNQLSTICGQHIYQFKRKQAMCRNAMVVIGQDTTTKINLLLFGNQSDACSPIFWKSFLSSFIVLESKAIVFESNNIVALESKQVSTMLGFNLKQNRDIVKLFKRNAFCEFYHFYFEERYLLLIG